MKHLSAVFMMSAFVFLVATQARAFPGLPEAFVGEYPSATNLETCGTCHVGFGGAVGSVNPYGAAIAAEMGSGSGHLEAFRAVEQDDSDGDGTSNIDEILTDAGFFPGWTCDTYLSAMSAPVGLADFVDPIDPGCTGVTTTTAPTITTTTTATTQSSTTTSTTVPVAGCAQPVTSGPKPVSTDCLFILNAAVGTETCSPECICSPNGDAEITATDALLCLNVAVGIDLPLTCPC